MRSDEHIDQAESDLHASDTVEGGHDALLWAVQSIAHSMLAIAKRTPWPRSNSFAQPDDEGTPMRSQ